MQKVINGILVQDKKLIILKKEVNGKSSWILPGGKPEPGESNLICLTREIAEELPFLKLGGWFYYYGSFGGISPHKNLPILAEVYRHHGFMNLDLRVSANPDEPIKEARQLSYDELSGLELSETTQKIIQSLRNRRYL